MIIEEEVEKTVFFLDLLNVIVCQLFENLAKDFVFEWLGLQGSFEYLIGELVDRTHSFGRVVAHILHHRCKHSQGPFT